MVEFSAYNETNKKVMDMPRKRALSGRRIAMSIGSVIATKRKALGMTQKELAAKLSVSFQAVSKWEQDAAHPDVDLLPALAELLGTSVDALVGYRSPILADYDERYQSAGFYWGIEPNRLCYDIMRLRPPVKPYKVLDIGCGEGKDAVFLARNGYRVSAIDISEIGLEKGRMLAEQCNTHVDFFKADIADYRLTEKYDIILSSGVFHFLKPELREEVTANLKKFTNEGGIHAINVFVAKPYVKRAPGKKGERYEWKSGELFTCYHDWYMHRIDEELFDCNSGGVPHQHCMDIMVAEKR